MNQYRFFEGEKWNRIIILTLIIKISIMLPSFQNKRLSISNSISRFLLRMPNSTVRSHHVASSRDYLALFEFTVFSLPSPRYTTPHHTTPHTWAHVCPFRRASAVHILARTVSYVRAPRSYTGTRRPRVCDICLGCTWRLSGVVWRTGGWLVWAGGR